MSPIRVSNHEALPKFSELFEAFRTRVTRICRSECDKLRKDRGATDGRAHRRDIFNSLPGIPQVVRH